MVYKDVQIDVVRINNIDDCYETLRQLDSRLELEDRNVVLDLSSDKALDKVLKQVGRLPYNHPIQSQKYAHGDVVASYGHRFAHIIYGYLDGTVSMIRLPQSSTWMSVVTLHMYSNNVAGTCILASAICRLKSK